MYTLPIGDPDLGPVRPLHPEGDGGLGKNGGAVNIPAIDGDGGGAVGGGAGVHDGEVSPRQRRRPPSRIRAARQAAAAAYLARKALSLRLSSCLDARCCHRSGNQS